MKFLNKEIPRSPGAARFVVAKSEGMAEPTQSDADLAYERTQEIIAELGTYFADGTLNQDEFLNSIAVSVYLRALADAAEANTYRWPDGPIQ